MRPRGVGAMSRRQPTDYGGADMGKDTTHVNLLVKEKCAVMDDPNTSAEQQTDPDLEIARESDEAGEDEGIGPDEPEKLTNAGEM